ncbi:unnamed protein product, partial [Allacma fusca]
FPKTENRNNTNPLLELSKANIPEANAMEVKIVDNATAIQTTISSGLVYNEIISSLEALTPSDKNGAVAEEISNQEIVDSFEKNPRIFPPERTSEREFK